MVSAHIGHQEKYCARRRSGGPRYPSRPTVTVPEPHHPIIAVVLYLQESACEHTAAVWRPCHCAVSMVTSMVPKKSLCSYAGGACRPQAYGMPVANQLPYKR